MKHPKDTTGDLFTGWGSAQSGDHASMSAAVMDSAASTPVSEMTAGSQGDDGAIVGRSLKTAGEMTVGSRGDDGVMTGRSSKTAGGITVGLRGEGGVIAGISSKTTSGMAGGSRGDDGDISGGVLKPERTNNPKKTIVKRYGKQAYSQPYLFDMDESEEGETLEARDSVKKVNEAYRIRRDISSESLDMPLALLGLDIRAGIEKDDRKWNAIFDNARDEIVKEISYLRLVLGDKMKVEVDWQLPLRWPYVALRTPDGRRIVETDSQEMMSHGVRSATMLWKSILDKQQLMQKMARDYNGLVRIAIALPKAMKKATAGKNAEKFVMTPEISNQINKLPWITYLGEDTGGGFCPLPYNLYESLRLRHWAIAEAVKNHIITMNMLYNLVQKEGSQKCGMPRRAGLAVRITTGKADIPVTSWALWINHRMKNLFYNTVTPRIRSKKHGKYISTYSFKITDEKGRLIGESIHKAHLSHMTDIYRVTDSVLSELQKLADKSGLQMQKIMGYRHAKTSPAAAGKASWKPSGRKLRWLPEQ